MTKKERLEAGKDEFPIPPTRSRFLVSDITPEGLSLIHAQNPRGLCLWSDELSAWFKNFNRYNSGSEEQFWLSVFNAKPTISDRKSSQSSIFIKRPYISVVGTIQQKILGELGKGERASNGFIDRILFVMPQSVQKSRWSDRETPEKLEQSGNALSIGSSSKSVSSMSRANCNRIISPFVRRPRENYMRGSTTTHESVIWKVTRHCSAYTVSWRYTSFALR